MNIAQKLADWLETHWITPAYAGWLLMGLAVFFFGAATNTLVGWLYVMSGVSFALLLVAAILPARSLKGIELYRKPIQPVSAGDCLTVDLEIINRTSQPKSLLQVYDTLPFVLGKPMVSPIESIAPHGTYKWTYYQPTERRGIYRWETVKLRTGAPLGLFYCRRSRPCKATAIVYPTVLPLSTCPILDRLGQDQAVRYKSDRQGFQSATEGITRGLRPYRVGDPIRLIHWRSSARYGDLRVRELEVISAGQDVAIALDSAAKWNLDDFEQAVIAAASLYFYASRRQMNVQLATAATGLLQGHRVVLEALAATYAGEESIGQAFGQVPVIWLSPNPQQVSFLPRGSRWILWSPSEGNSSNDFPGLTINREESLQLQLQKLPS
ncbi:DUF58 domain-containing protein [Oscillatoria amoena NRMC-F 0135]|nr:DUF58 domain-containing protein [Oscillatoria laete-virens]MCD8488542.1 DUF58 domain-containing protein [Desertifilum sp.]MDI9637811.1 DUF58 domain-containing protein [Geitlerinema splendidum]MDL5051179.1 DUF58 domain-containing protein [Oscillatoria amoena NRMC-F 0135]MDL5052372.1 DUF58 domain-containing protein [Oscillatoria laete-virens NRMC-F 0139]